jgi:hypothetical protein
LSHWQRHRFIHRQLPLSRIPEQSQSDPEFSAGRHSNIPKKLLTIPQIRTIFRLSPCRHEGRFAVVTKRGAGCDGRLRRQAFSDARRKRRERTAKSCGSGAATVALKSA